MNTLDLNTPPSALPATAPPTMETRFTLRDFVHTLLRQKWKILVVLLASIAITVPSAMKMEDIYESTAKLLIQIGRANMAMDPTVMGPTMFVDQKLENQINSEVAILKNGRLLRKVVEKLGPGVVYGETNSKKPTPDSQAPEDVAAYESEIEGALYQVAKGFKVDVEKDTNILQLSLQLKYDAHIPKKILEEIIREYEIEHLEVHRVQATPEFFMENLDKLRGYLHAKEQELADFLTENQIVNIGDQQRNLVERLSNLQAKYDENLYRMDTLASRVKSLKKQIENEPNEIIQSRAVGTPNPVANQLKDQLNTLLMKEQELSNRYQPESRALSDLRAQIQNTQQLLDKEEAVLNEVTYGINSTREQLRLQLLQDQAELQATEASLSELAKEIDNQRQAIADFSAMEVFMDRLKREIASKVAEYDELDQSYRRSKFSDLMDQAKISSVKILESATFSDEPVAPNRNAFIMFGITLGIFGGIAFAFLVEFLDDSVRSAKEVSRYLKLPVLATVQARDYKKCLKK